ncbi:MAG: DUF4433 domain-containing protein [Deltaproteobacteria bacterium]|nr:DUF4433 domain-containing protein [Deltaproteobacteria bacterium]
MPVPTPIFRMVHVENLATLLERQGLHSPNNQPNDGRPYRVIHDVEMQAKRQVRSLPCGPRGVIHDYVSFYFGPRSPMLLRLQTGRVQGYTGDQTPIIYLVSSVERIREMGVPFIFSNGHGVAYFTGWFDNEADLHKVDWEAVYAKRWNDTLEDMDRERRKQAEFLVHRFCAWEAVERIAVVNPQMKTFVETILAAAAPHLTRPVEVRADWYY